MLAPGLEASAKLMGAVRRGREAHIPAPARANETPPCRFLIALPVHPIGDASRAFQCGIDPELHRTSIELRPGRSSANAAESRRIVHEIVAGRSARRCRHPLRRKV